MKIRPDRTAIGGQERFDAEKAGLKKAARQFEAIFLKQMLGQMRKSVGESGLLGKKGPSSGLYDHMMDSAVADDMSQGQGVGIADFLYRQWTGERLNPIRTSAAATPVGLPPSAPSESAVAAEPSVNETKIVETSQPKTSDPGRDNGLIPLRDLMPPTGIETDGFFLRA